MPRPSPPPWAPCALRRRADGNVAAVSPRPTRSHAHRCSRLTRQHGGEQSDLMTLTFDFLTLKVVPESRVTWATSLPILVFLGLSVLDLGPMYATDRQTDVRQHHHLMPPPRGRGHNNGLRRLPLPQILYSRLTYSHCLWHWFLGSTPER